MWSVLTSDAARSIYADVCVLKDELNDKIRSGKMKRCTFQTFRLRIENLVKKIDFHVKLEKITADGFFDSIMM